MEKILGQYMISDLSNMIMEYGTGYELEMLSELKNHFKTCQEKYRSYNGPYQEYFFSNLRIKMMKRSVKLNKETKKRLIPIVKDRMIAEMNQIFANADNVEEIFSGIEEYKMIFLDSDSDSD